MLFWGTGESWVVTNPTLATATDLTLWAAQRDAQERLPQLVRRLILTTAPAVTRISFPAGEGVQKPGWDGVAVIEAGNAFVPVGVLALALLLYALFFPGRHEPPAELDLAPSHEAGGGEGQVVDLDARRRGAG